MKNQNSNIRSLVINIPDSTVKELLKFQIMKYNRVGKVINKQIVYYSANKFLDKMCMLGLVTKIKSNEINEELYYFTKIGKKVYLFFYKNNIQDKG